MAPDRKTLLVNALIASALAAAFVVYLTYRG
jgi:hypothetical protein